MAKDNIFGRAKESNLYKNLPKNRTVYSEKDIDYVMGLTAKASLQYMAEMTAELLYYYTVNDFYSKREPKNYNRTFELLDSITVSPQGENGSEVYFDINKIHGHRTGKGTWNQHMSTPTRDEPTVRNVRKFIPIMAEEGNGGSSMYSYEGGHMMESTLRHISEEIESLRLQLDRNGVSLSF